MVCMSVPNSDCTMPGAGTINDGGNLAKYHWVLFLNTCRKLFGQSKRNKAVPSSTCKHWMIDAVGRKIRLQIRGEIMRDRAMT